MEKINEFDAIECDDAPHLDSLLEPYLQPQHNGMNNSGVTEHNIDFVNDMEITDDLHVMDRKKVGI